MSIRQREAIEAPLGPVLVVAGPGAGKTFCLIGRVAYLLQHKLVEPHRICAVTFTNRAAEEITARLRAAPAIGAAAEDITRGTLHALCLQILRDHGEVAGLKRGFGVADEEYQKVILGRLSVAAKRRSPMLTRFGRHRLQAYELAPEEASLFRRYTGYLRKQNLIDFDDIIAITASCFEQHPEVADEVSRRWDYVLVDEFQDLNEAQYAIVRRLASRHGNFFAVGDDEQSIFSWTGADPGILSRFRRDQAVEPIILDENRRCSRQIFETARRLLRGNRSLFDKQLRAERESKYPVSSVGFPEENAEARWLIADLAADRSATNLGWGDYAILYRKHTIGENLEAELLQAGVPCRLAPGRALPDDHVIAYIMASLRLITRPGDMVAVEAAAKPLPEDLRQHVRTIASRKKLDFLSAMRDLAFTKGEASRESKIAWRFIRYVENLTALARTESSLRGLVHELLSQRVNRFENRLEERHSELTDPLAVPGVASLADRLAQTEGSVWVPPAGGMDLALRRMLRSGGYDVATSPENAAVVISPADAKSGSLPLVVFKALQAVRARTVTEGFTDYVAFDFETTDLDVHSCDVVEIGAVRVENGAVVQRFHSLVRPTRPISAMATAVHGYDASDVRDAPTFGEIWPAFREFIGDQILVAHNGQEFDVPVLERLAKPLGGSADLIFFDTLPLARSLYPTSRKLEDLAAGYGLPVGRSHHALDDALTLAEVFTRLHRDKLVRARKSSLANVLDWLAVALVLDPVSSKSDECETLLDIARPYALGRYSDCLQQYEGDRELGQRTDAPPLAEVIERLGGEQRMARIRAERSTAERFAAELDRLERLLAASEAEGSLGGSIDRFLDLVALSTSQGVAVDPNRVNLLTLHSTKGLEFSRVYVVGAEDRQLPGLLALERNLADEVEEARRLLYVGMTRAKDRLVLTHTEARDGDARGKTRFLEEMGFSAVTDGRTVGRSDGRQNSEEGFEKESQGPLLLS